MKTAVLESANRRLTRLHSAKGRAQVRVVDIVNLPKDMFPFTRMFWVANA